MKIVTLPTRPGAASFASATRAPAICARVDILENSPALYSKRGMTAGQAAPTV